MTETGSFWQVLRLPSTVPYFLWRARGRHGAVTLTLKEGPRLMLRPADVGNNDYGVAYEIFVHRHYECPRPLAADSVSLIVDLGANVGFSCLYWLAHYPRATVLAVEPHPGHLAQCRANIAANALLPRVELHHAAAGTEAGTMILHAAGTSTHVSREGADGPSVPMLDIFALLGERQVDIFKLDIEGGEYEILADQRFARLRPRCLVMEWHGGPADRDWCKARFGDLGYDVLEIFDHSAYGMLWAFRGMDGRDGPI